MPDQSEPITDPLLRPDLGPRDARGAPVRAPLGNSAMTLGLVVVLVVLGIAVWWLRQPDDLSTQIGGRQWVITDVDGDPATNEVGTASTFVLDGSGEVRATLGCNIVTGEWSYRTGSDRLTIDWTTQTELICPPDWPTTHLPDSGEVDLAGGVLQVTSNDGDFRAVSLDDLPAINGEEAAGDWTAGDEMVEIGRRGLFRIEACEGNWRAVDRERAVGADPTDEVDELMDVRFDEVQIQREGCDLDRLWLDDDPFRAVEFDGSVYLHRTRTIFPLDRDVVRLDPNDANSVLP